MEMHVPTEVDFYAAAYGIGRAQAAGPLPMSFGRTALYALGQMPGVDPDRVMRQYRQGLDDYYAEEEGSA